MKENIEEKDQNFQVEIHDGHMFTVLITPVAMHSTIYLQIHILKEIKLKLMVVWPDRFGICL